MRFFLISCLLIFTACNQTAKVPKDVLAVPQMTNVLWDMMLADELVNHRYPMDTGTIRFDTSLVLYSQIAQAHQTNQKQFKQSLEYYKTRPDLMQVILDTLNNRTVLPPPTSKDSLKVE